MTKVTHSTFKPSAFAGVEPMSSVLNDYTYEIVAQNCLQILKREGDQWHQLDDRAYSAGRLKDGATKQAIQNELPYFRKVVAYTVSPEKAAEFSPYWHEVLTKPALAAVVKPTTEEKLLAKEGIRGAHGQVSGVKYEEKVHNRPTTPRQVRGLLDLMTPVQRAYYIELPVSGLALSACTAEVGALVKELEKLHAVYTHKVGRTLRYFPFVTLREHLLAGAVKLSDQDIQELVTLRQGQHDWETRLAQVSAPRAAPSKTASSH